MFAILISICLGIGLSAAAGFRVFVPLFVLSVATHLGYIPVDESFIWIGSLTAMICFGIATIIEILAYYIPYIDNLLDTISVPLAGVAGTIVMVSTLVELDPMITWGLAIIAGGGTAAAIGATTSATRAASTVSTGGLGNNIVATTETATASLVSVTAIFLPILGFLVVILIVFIGIKLFRKLIVKK